MINTDTELLLKKLIEVESMSGNELPILTLIQNLLEEEGFKINRIPVSQSTFCIMARIGEPKVVLQAHVDTVQPFIPLSEDEKNIYGRGSCDTKGSIAAMITAAVNAKRNNSSNFGLLFTVEEETCFRGAIKAAKLFKDIPPYFIVGEPSSLKPITCHFGIATYVITVQGKAAHTSMPETGINAIDLLLEAYPSLKSLKLGPGTLCTMAQISGGIAPNIVPAQVQLILSLRIAPGDPTDYLKEIKRLVPLFDVKEDGYLPPVKSSLPKKLSFLGEGETVRYCTELAFFRHGCILGPGDIRFAHSTDEYVSKSELAEAVVKYRQIINAFQ